MRNPLKKQRTVVSKTVQPATANLALAEWSKKDPGMMVKIGCQRTGADQFKYDFIDEVTVQDIADNHGNIELFLRDRYQGGTYQIQFIRGALVLNSYVGIGIAGEPGHFTKKARRSSSDNGAEGKKEKEPTFFEKIALKAVEKALEQKDGDGGALSEQMFATMMEFFVNKATNQESEIEKIIQLREAGFLTPQIQPQDPSMALFQSLAPVAGQVLTGLLAGKGNKQATQPDLAAFVNSPEIQQLIASPEGQKALQQLQQQQPAAQAAPGALPTRNVPMSPPGQPMAPAGQPMSPPDQPFVSTPTTTPTTPPQADPMVSAEVGRFQKAIIDGTSGDALADKLEFLVKVQRLALEANPDAMNPLLAGFVQHTDIMELGSDLDTFCNAIPELASRPDIRAELSSILAARYGPDVDDPTPERQPVAGGPFDGMSDEQRAELHQEFSDILPDNIGDIDHEADSGLGQDTDQPAANEDQGDGPEAGGPQFDARDPQTSDGD